KRVLVVDDDPGIRDALRMILEYEGYQVLTAADGKTALASLDADSVDAVLLDIKMPGMDGLEILDRIAEREAAPPVLMLSGHGDGSHHGGERDGQGTRRARDSRGFPGRRQPVHPGQLRGDSRRADRIRALRPREGVLHRSRAPADREVRRGRRRHDFLGRG